MGEKIKKEKISPFADQHKDKYGLVFLTALAISAAVMLIYVIPDGGVFTYYGDFNYQQIPFYYHVHEAVRNGCLMWDFTTDLGSDIMQAYTFYLMGSPFFWITIPFPNGAVPYLIPWLLCLKTAVAALTSYAYIRRFSDNANACFLGALLYAFSGFQLYNIFFNHFHDATAFFPLLLLASDKLAQDNRRGAFAAAVALCAASNYFFFAGMAVFTVIYYIVNIITKRYGFTVKGFLIYAFEALLGVICAAAVLLPSAAAVMTNGRAGETLPPSLMLAYINDPAIYVYIIKGFFTFPDLCVKSVFEISDQLEASSLSAYLPFVSMCGVFAYMAKPEKRRTMPAVMFLICLVMMFVPILNAAFYMFNAQYYARWFYMPVLMLCLMTAKAAEDDVMSFKKGIIPCVTAAGLYLIGGILYGSISGTEINISYLAVQSIMPAGALMLLYSMLTDKSVADKSAADNCSRLTGLIKRTAVFCGFSMLVIIALGKMDNINIDDYVTTAVKSPKKIQSEIKDIQPDPDTYFRVDMCEQYRNRNLMWNMSSCQSFISIVSPSINEFYEGIGLPRGVTSASMANYEALRCLLSVKYYFDIPIYSDEGIREPFEKLNGSIESFDYLKDVSGMHVYENNCYIPMGFTYDYYVTTQDMEELDSRYYRMQTLLEALVLYDEQIERHKDILEKYDISRSHYDYSGLREISKEKNMNCCDYFYTDRKGFDAKISLDSEKLVFFSVPYDKNWTAYVNGEKAEIEKVSYGFMAVCCGKGENIIRFDYTSKPTLYGAYISLGGIFILIVYLLFCGRRKTKK